MTIHSLKSAVNLLILIDKMTQSGAVYLAYSRDTRYHRFRHIHSTEPTAAMSLKHLRRVSARLTTRNTYLEGRIWQRQESQSPQAVLLHLLALHGKQGGDSGIYTTSGAKLYLSGP